MTNLKTYEAEALIREEFEWMRWVREVPFLAFPAGWQIRVIPPFGGAVVRFLVRRGDTPEEASVSVYLDCYGRLGASSTPYWEIYPAENGDTFRCGIYETDNLLAGITGGLDRLADSET